MLRIFYFLVFLAISFGASAQADDVEFGAVVIEMGNAEFELEHAQTWEQRARGLMFRKTMCADCGMLFSFNQVRIGSIWMKNTFIPLDLAYVDDKGIITDIVQLKPHDLNPVKSSKPVFYAIEMNEGWFAEKGIKVGDSIKIAAN